MRKILSVSCIIAALGTYPLNAEDVPDNLRLDRYSCSEFLANAKKPVDGQELLRSLMMIAWTTGYAAAHQQKEIHADSKALQLIAAVLGAGCQKNPEKLVSQVGIDAINDFIKTASPTTSK